MILPAFSVSITAPLSDNPAYSATPPPIKSMFKKFTPGECISGTTQAKASVVRGIRAKLSEQYPDLADYIDDIIPKKEPLHIVKCHDHIEILVRDSELLMFRQRDGPYMPTLRLLHKYPTILPRVQVDKGAIKFLLSGANIMCPGLTSPGAKMDVSLPEDTVVAVMAEGKEHCVSIGITKMSTEEIIRVNKGIGVENVHFLRDGLWNMKTFHR